MEVIKINFREKIKHENFEGVLLFVLALISTLLLYIYKNNNDSFGVLITSLLFLLVMFAIFLGNRKENKILLVSGSLVYIWIAWYWLSI